MFLIKFPFKLTNYLRSLFKIFLTQGKDEDEDDNASCDESVKIRMTDVERGTDQDSLSFALMHEAQLKVRFII